MKGPDAPVSRLGTALAAAPGSSELLRMESEITVGHRVILTAATSRRADALGTVIADDPYTERDAIVHVGFEDGVARWVRRDRLRRLGDGICPTAPAEWLAKYALTATSPTSEGEGIASDPRLATVKGSASVEAAPSPSGGKERAGDGQA